MTKKGSEEIRNFIIDNLKLHERDIINHTVEEFGISRQAINKHMRKLIDEKLVKKTGDRKSVVYDFVPLEHWEKTFSLDGLKEDVVFRNDIKGKLLDLPDNVFNVWNYGFAEMLNNAIDHSEGGSVTVIVDRNIHGISMGIVDDGIGIFNKIKRDLDLDDVFFSLLELSKGKVTSDPKRHSGEGIFFTSRMFDDFVIVSGELVYTHQAGIDKDDVLDVLHDWHDKKINGTYIYMYLKNDSPITTEEVFNDFTGSDFTFSKTIVPVELARFGNENLVSRSQAKRMLLRVDKFEFIVLDFKGVDSIGQGFADEVFRVFANDHPKITISVINTSQNIDNMISHVTVEGN